MVKQYKQIEEMTLHKAGSSAVTHISEQGLTLLMRRDETRCGAVLAVL